MAYNHGKEEKQFQRMWRKFRKEYREAGMSDEAIEEMYRFDRDVFNRDRAFNEHKYIPPNTNDDDSDEDEINDFDKLEFSVSDDFSSAHSRYWWIEEIDNPLILGYIKTLSIRDIEIITLCIFEGFEQQDAARLVGLSPATLCYRLNKIKKILKNISDFRI